MTTSELLEATYKGKTVIIKGHSLDLYRMDGEELIPLTMNDSLLTEQRDAFVTQTVGGLIPLIYVNAVRGVYQRCDYGSRNEYMHRILLLDGTLLQVDDSENLDIVCIHTEEVK